MIFSALTSRGGGGKFSVHRRWGGGKISVRRNLKIPPPPVAVNNDRSLITTVQDMSDEWGMGMNGDQLLPIHPTRPDCSTTHFGVT